MASIKALAAVGLLIVIVAPIGLGYALAIDEGETTGWQTVDRANISDLILNSQTAYTMDYAGPANNSQILYTRYAPGTGTYTEIGGPDYVDVGSVYTSIPQYSETSGSKALASADVFDYSLTSGGGVGVGSYRYALSGNYFMLSITSDATSLHWQLDYGSRSVLSKSPTVAIRDGEGTYTLYNQDLPGGHASGISTWGYTTDATGKVTVVKSYYTTLGVSGTYQFTLQSYGLELTHQGGAKTYVQHYGGLSSVLVSSMGTVTADGNTYEAVSSVALATSAGVGTLQYTTVAPTGLYASPSQGWRVDPEAVSSVWTNGALNAAVTLYIVPEGHTVTLSKHTGQTVGPAMTIVQTGGRISIDGQDLGRYPALSVVVDKDGYTVTGIKGWPSMGGPVEGYNSIRILSPSGVFDGLSLGGDRATYRVDNAEVVTGYFSSTADYTLDLESLYPDKSLMVEFTGIGVYGDYIGIGADRYEVEDGRITADGRSYAVKGLKISAMETDGTYIVSLDGAEIGTAEGLPSVTLGGEWSLGAVVYTLQETTVKTMTWIPGGFGLDKEGMAAAGLLCCGIAFLVLGLTGKAGGPKVALLGLVLGGAATVYLIIL